MKRLLCFLMMALILATTLSVFAQTPCLVVWLSSGEKAYYALDEQPITTYRERCLVVTTSSLSVSYPLENVNKFTYDNLSTGIRTAESLRKLWVEGNILYASGLNEGSLLQVYTTDGRLLTAVESSGADVTTVVLGKLPKCVLVVKVNGLTQKFLKQ